MSRQPGSVDIVMHTRLDPYRLGNPNAHGIRKTAVELMRISWQCF